MKFKVTFDDGDVREFKVKPRHLVEHEDITKGDDDNLIARSYKLAWLASGSDDSFKDWLANVDEIETLDVPDMPETTDPDGSGEKVPTRRRSRG
jgi:hypothetical protein